jgi:formate dehydrogenase maturation protein FdhE
MTSPPHGRPERADTPEVAALRRLKLTQPELVTAIDMQIEVLILHRRMQGRVSTPWIDLDVDRVAQQLAAGTPVIRFEDIPFDWTEFRILFRQLVDLLRRFEAVDQPDYEALQRMVRASRPQPAEVAAWWNGSAVRPTPSPSDGAVDTAAYAQVLTLAARPFVARAAQSVQQRVDVTAWQRPQCPFCLGDPELGLLTVAGDRHLICGRCTGSWPFDAGTCPFCDNRNPACTTSFTSQDGRYRLTACDVCRRYLKSYDARGADRPVMLDVDTIATLPLDAAAMQRGYTG